MIRRLFASYATTLGLVGMRVVGAAAAFGLNLVMARSMGAAEMGTALTWMSLAMLLAIGATMSIEAGSVRYMAEYRAKARPDLARGFLAHGRRVTALAGAALVVLGAALAYLLDAPLALALPALATAYLMGWVRLGAQHAMGLGAVLRSFAPNTLFRQVGLLIALLGWVWATGALSAPMVLNLLLLSVLLTVVIQYILYRPIMAHLGRVEPDRSAWRDWMVVGLQTGLALLFVEYSRDLTLAFAAIALAPADIALLGVATALVGFARFAVVAVTQSVTPKLAAAIAEGREDDALALIDASNHMKFWPILAGTALLAAIGGWVLSWFGEPFIAASSILIILMAEPVAMAFFGPAPNVLSMKGEQQMLVPRALLSLATLAIGIQIGASLGGLTGAAIAVSLAWLVWTASLALACRTKTGIDTSLIGTLRRAYG